MTVRGLLVGACLVSAGLAHGAVTTLSDRNSVARIEDSGAFAGMNSWTIDGTSMLSLQGFWYRTPGMNREFNIGTLPITGLSASDTNPFVDPSNDTLGIQYTGVGFTIEPTWTLRGGAAGSLRSDMIETITITNTSTFQPLTISFFQYSDFDLNGTIADQSVGIFGALRNTAIQSDTGGFVLNETVVTPAPTRWQVDTFPTILNALDNGGIDNLNNNFGPIGPGDLTWAFQWDLVIPIGGSVVISKDKNIVPAPTSLALLGLSGLLARRRR